MQWKSNLCFYRVVLRLHSHQTLSTSASLICECDMSPVVSQHHGSCVNAPWAHREITCCRRGGFWPIIEMGIFLHQGAQNSSSIWESSSPKITQLFCLFPQRKHCIFQAMDALRWTWEMHFPRVTDSIRTHKVQYSCIWGCTSWGPRVLRLKDMFGVVPLLR